MRPSANDSLEYTEQCGRVVLLLTTAGQSNTPSAMSTSIILLRPARGLPAYIHHLLRISTVQVCRESGYRQSSHAALDTLTSLVQHLIRELGLTARHYAELSGRAEVNLVDVLNALDDYQYDVNTLLDYHIHSDQLPFPRTLPNFPTPRAVTRVQPPVGGLVEGGGVRRAAHIPPYLPRWPEERTYKRSEVRVHTELNTADKRHKRMEQNRAVEHALMHLQQAERQPNTDATDAAATSKLKSEQAREASDRRLNDPSTHQPATAPPPPFPHRERERERAMAKNPYLAPLAPPQPPSPLPMEADAGNGPAVESGVDVQAVWSETTFGANPPPPRSPAATSADSDVSRSRPAAPPPVTEDADIEI